MKTFLICFAFFFFMIFGIMVQCDALGPQEPNAIQVSTSSTLVGIVIACLFLAGIVTYFSGSPSKERNVEEEEENDRPVYKKVQATSTGKKGQVFSGTAKQWSESYKISRDLAGLYPRSKVLRKGRKDVE